MVRKDGSILAVLLSSTAVRDEVTGTVPDEPGDDLRPERAARGGTPPKSLMLFDTIGVHGYFMEYNSARAGGFEPLRFVPKGKTVVLGLVTSKIGVLESRDEPQAAHRGGDEVRRHRSALPVPQCGFASTEDGNTLVEDGNGQARHDRRTGR